MENGPPAIVLEDGAIDVENMLVEPQDEHLSMDSVMCFNKKIPENAAGVEDVSRSSGIASSVTSSLLSGGSDTGTAQEGKDALNGEVLNVMPSEVGYFQLDDDFSSMGEEYLLGVEFAESITNLDYGSSEGLQASVSDSQIQVSSAGSDTTSKTDPFRTLGVSEGQNDQYTVGSSDLSDVPSSNECRMLVVGNPFPLGSCNLQNIGKFRNSSRSSFEDTLSDENGGRFSPAGVMLCSPKTGKKDVFELIGQDQDGARNVSQGQETSAAVPVQAVCSDVLPTQKRSRKPTQRYIDEFVDPCSTNFKKRREVSSSTRKDKSRGVKDQKKCLMGPKSVKPPPEESSVIAIQVPFGPLGNQECPDDYAYDMVPHVDSGYQETKSKGKCVSPHNQNRYGIGKGDDYATSQKKMEKRDDYATRQKKVDSCITPAQSKKRDPHSTVSSQKKRDPHSTVSSQKKRDPHSHSMALIRKEKDDGDNCHANESDECPTAERAMEVNGRRKHHRVWSINEVRKLIDGVSQYGVGRWSRIKKLFFSASPHRTSVDLKDKWRNLLKASGVLEQGNQQGEKKRNMAWRPLPKSILRRVCELANMYPYPKGQRHNKIAHFLHDSPDRSTDITLNDYRRILRSISGN